MPPASRAGHTGSLTLADLLHPDGRRLELRRAGLRVGRVDREHVDVDVVGEVHRHEGEARTQARIEAHRRLDGAAPRGDPDDLAGLDAEALGVLRAQVERLAAAQRRAVEARLHAGVVGVQAPAGGQPDREVVVELVDRRGPRRDRERRERAADGLVPQAPVQELASPGCSSSGHGHWMPPSSSSRA